MWKVNVQKPVPLAESPVRTSARFLTRARLLMAAPVTVSGPIRAAINRSLAAVRVKIDVADLHAILHAKLHVS